MKGLSAHELYSKIWDNEGIYTRKIAMPVQTNTNAHMHAKKKKKHAKNEK